MYLPKLNVWAAFFFLFLPLILSSSAKILTFEVMFLTYSSVSELSPEDDYTFP